MKCSACHMFVRDSNRCTGCFRAQYCSKGCQRSHWSEHKLICTATRHPVTNTDQRPSVRQVNKGSPFQHATTKPDTTGRKEEEANGKNSKACCNCSKAGALMVCGRCKGVQYCSIECQKQDWSIHKMSCIKHTGTAANKLSPTTCVRCDKKGRSYRRCTGCLLVHYCSVDCQREHWPLHKPSCAAKPSSGRTALQDTTPVNTNIRDEANTAGADTRMKQAVKKTIGTGNDGSEIHAAAAVDQHESITNIVELEIDKGKMQNITHAHQHVSVATGKRQDRVTDVPAPKTLEEMEKRRGELDNCHNCNTMAFAKPCSRSCLIKYCSVECQKQDLLLHKAICQDLLEVDGYIETPMTKEGRLRDKGDDVYKNKPKTDQADSFFETLFGCQYFQGGPTREERRMTAERPHGSLSKAIRLAKLYFPDNRIVDNFNDLPTEHPFLDSTPESTVLVAFMFRYHDHVVSHAICLKDKNDDVTYVQFVIVNDSPEPYFRYSDLKPGAYICLENIRRPYFIDDTPAIEIVVPWTVRILENNLLQ